MTYLIVTIIIALATGWILGVPYCGAGAVAVAAIAFAWEKRK